MAETRAFVVGHPIAHSRSPLLHGFWLRALGVDGSYERIDVAPADFPAFLSGLRERGFAGGNVTIPHKEAAFAAVERLDEAASAIGAVNTLWFEDGRLCGGNTDAYGFSAHLDETAPGWHETEKAVVLGAGGAARAILFALIGKGVGEIHLLNRTPARAEELAARFGPAVRPRLWSDLPDALSGSGLLVNTTALGMAGKPPLEVDISPLAADAVVSDIVYVPLMTPLLKAAEARGLRTVDGLGMLLHQAVPGFERWFGRRPTVGPELRALVERDIEASA